MGGDGFRVFLRLAGCFRLGGDVAGGAAGALVCAAGDLPLATRVGVTMVSVCPGGVASNAVAFLARADVPLSVATTRTIGHAMIEVARSGYPQKILHSRDFESLRG